MQARTRAEDLDHVQENGLLELPTGVALQYKLIPPPTEVQRYRGQEGGEGSRGKKLAVCLHPWSWLGGRMNDPYVFLAAHA